MAAAARARYGRAVSPPTRLFLIRHALVEASARARFYGSLDVGLCAIALVEEATTYEALAARLPRPAHWVVTPLMRTRATAAAIFAAGYPEAPLAEEPALAEQHLGEWQGIAHDALPPLLRAPAHPFWPHAGAERPPGGESFADLRDRVGPALEALCARHAGEDVVVIAHGGTIRAALAHALDLTPDQALSFSVRNLSLTRLERHGPHWRVQAVNEEVGA